MGAFHALLVEGVPGIGKSTLIDALIRRHVAYSEPRRVRSFLHLAQTHTYGPLARAEDAGTLTVSENLALFDRIVQTLEWLHADLRHSDKPCFVLIDSLHLTHCVRPGVVAWADVAPIDRRLSAIGCKLLLLAGNERTIRKRLIESRAESQFLVEYARKFGSTADEIHAHFVAENAEFGRMFAQSAMRKAAIANDCVPEVAVEEAWTLWRGGGELRRADFLTMKA